MKKLLAMNFKEFEKVAKEHPELTLAQVIKQLENKQKGQQ